MAVAAAVVVVGYCHVVDNDDCYWFHYNGEVVVVSFVDAVVVFDGYDCRSAEEEDSIHQVVAGVHRAAAEERAEPILAGRAIKRDHNISPKSPFHSLFLISFGTSSKRYSGDTLIEPLQRTGDRSALEKEGNEWLGHGLPRSLRPVSTFTSKSGFPLVAGRQMTPWVAHALPSRRLIYIDVALLQ